jgi:hypothetical protein
MSSHSHLLRDDLRGPLLPIDSLSHISRINDWTGSDSWVEGCRKDKPMPDDKGYPEPKLLYRLLHRSYHDGAMRNAGEVVAIEPSKRGAQHAKIEGHEYPDLPEPVPPGAGAVARMSDDDRQMLVYCQGLERRIAELETWRNALSAPKTVYQPDQEKEAAARPAPSAPAAGTPVVFGSAPAKKDGDY